MHSGASEASYPGLDRGRANVRVQLRTGPAAKGTRLTPSPPIRDRHHTLASSSGENWRSRVEELPTGLTVRTHSGAVMAFAGLWPMNRLLSLPARGLPRDPAPRFGGQGAEPEGREEGLALQCRRLPVRATQRGQSLLRGEPVPEPADAQRPVDLAQQGVVTYESVPQHGPAYPFGSQSSTGHALYHSGQERAAQRDLRVSPVEPMRSRNSPENRSIPPLANVVPRYLGRLLAAQELGLVSSRRKCLL